MKSITPIPSFSTKNLCFYSNEYSYGFNGKDKESEFNSGAYDFGARIHDARLGRWKSVDRGFKNYPRTSPYVAILNSPMIHVDSDGNDVFIIIDTGGNYFGRAMKTRKKEIESGNGFNKDEDIVLILKVTDLGKLKETIAATVNEYSGKYGKTREVNFFGHCATDGPVGSEETSRNSLSDCTGNTGFTGDQKQLSAEGWQEIDFNFDTDGSLVAFYGCNSATFAERFLTYQEECDFAVGLGGKAGASYEACGEFSYPLWNPFGRNEYAVDADDGIINSKIIYSSQTDEEGIYYDDCSGNTIVPKTELPGIYGNVTLNDNTNTPQGTSGCQ